jgi:release factor glutamine methyltransferase
MTASVSFVPLLVRLELTADQQRQIRDQTGVSITAIPFESDARFLRMRFGGVALQVPRGVFVPNPASEQLLACALDSAAGRPHPTMIDVGTGCGAVALAAAHALPSATIYATETSDAALRSARRNRTRLGIRNVRFSRGSLLSSVPRRLRGNVSVIVANVPYVPPRLTAAFAGAVPVGTAIGTGEDGLGLVRELADAARSFLAARGSLVLQLADFQWADFSTAATALGYQKPRLRERSGAGPVVGQLTWPG